jgi:CheY-like chemotaxis protein
MCLIALRGYGLEEAEREALVAGFDFHLVKPVDPQLLLQAISFYGM